MKHKVSELDGALLDAAVAKAEGKWSTESVTAIAENPGVWSPSQNWQFGGPIIERERISVVREHLSPRLWCAGLNAEIGPHNRLDYASFGPTPLIAAMRAYVASKFGDEVGLP